MKAVAGLGMGPYRIGYFVLILTVFLFGMLFAPIYAEPEVNTSRSIPEPDIWYIYTPKEISQNISFELPIVINSTGELKVKSGSSLELIQKYDYQRNITVKDNGTLHVRSGTLYSNYCLNIHLEDNGRLIIENGGELKVTKLTATDNALIRLSSSMLSSGKGGFIIDISGKSTLELIESKIEGAEEFSAHENSKIKLRNGTIDSEKYAISCNEINLISNNDLQDLMVNSCERLTIHNSKVTGLNVITCNYMTSASNSKIIDSKINFLGIGRLSSAEINDLRLDDVNELEITGCKVNILKIHKMVKKLKILNSEVSQLDVENCQTLETYNTHFDNSELHSSLDLVEFHSSTIEHCSIFPLEIKIYDSIIIGNEDELNDLTRGRRLDAYNSSFNSPLHFTGTSSAHLINCSTLNEIPPKVIVDEDAKIYIYWWLNVQVLDNHSKPLSGASVSACDFITNNAIKTAQSDENGRVRFSLLANTITKKGWRTNDNKTYFVQGDYNGLFKMNGTLIKMDKNMESNLEFLEVKESKSKPQQFFTQESLIGIIIFILIIILVAYSFTSGKKPKNRSNNNRGRNRGSSGVNNIDKIRNRPVRKPKLKRKPDHYFENGTGTGDDLLKPTNGYTDHLPEPKNNHKQVNGKVNGNGNGKVVKKSNGNGGGRSRNGNYDSVSRIRKSREINQKIAHMITLNRRLK